LLYNTISILVIKINYKQFFAKNSLVNKFV